MTIHAYAAHEAKRPLQAFTYEPDELGPFDVEIAITHCGICHSDLHLIDNDWGFTNYPLVPGHEIIGIVQAVGTNVTNLARNQRVGVGWQCGSCLECEWCLKGKETCCAKYQWTCVGRHGGFAKAIRVDSRFVFPIPDQLAAENAAPLLCAGITVYSPLSNLGVRPSSRVGVIGIGGLGHLALQFAHAMGCEVTAFSTTAAKEEEARRLGANHFAEVSDPSQIKQWIGTQDLLISTAIAKLDWEVWVSVLRPHGTLCIVGASPGTIDVTPMALIMGQKCVCGSGIGNRSTIAEMLDFAARHNIQAQTQVMAMAKVNEALDVVRNNEARYRVVLEN